MVFFRWVGLVVELSNRDKRVVLLVLRLTVLNNEQEFYTSSESNIADAAGQDALVVRTKLFCLLKFNSCLT